MNEYLALLALAYFREKQEEYSLEELKTNLGLTYTKLDRLLEDLMEQKLLEYENHMIRISFRGRMMLMNSKLENYRSVDNLEQHFTEEPWAPEKPYPILGFSQKQWRGNS